MSRKQYIVKNAVEHDNERYEPGSSIVLDEKVAESLLAASAIAFNPDAPLFVDEANIPTDAKERMAAIVVAIGKLDPANEDAWLKDGKPSSEAIAAELGWPVTAAERNVAWAFIQSDK